MSSEFDKNTPFFAKLKERWLLTKPGSTKQTYHVVLDLQGRPLKFKVGDAIAVIAENDPTLVQHLVDALGAKGTEVIHDPKSGLLISLREFLLKKANLSRLTSSFLKLFNHEPHLLQTENRPLLLDYLGKHDPLHVLKQSHELQVPLQEVCAQFGPLLPRFYSVASSPLAHPDEVHLTVALFTYEQSGEKRFGVASHFLCHLAKEEETPIPIYVQPSHAFTLPEDDHTPLIMIGPGTGVAPYRAFLQERLHRGAKGKHWLFFGERQRQYDFFYEDFWNHLSTSNFLRLETAFSRDQAEKVYVQHQMLRHAGDIWKWLQEGAHFYVCGDAHRMAKDVHATLFQIAREQGNLSEDDAKAHLKALRAQKRYQIDVY